MHPPLGKPHPMCEHVVKALCAQAGAVWDDTGVATNYEPFALGEEEGDGEEDGEEDDDGGSIPASDDLSDGEIEARAVAAAARRVQEGGPPTPATP